MTGQILAKLFEHNNWANLQIIRACANLSDAQLDAEPLSATRGNIRSTLLHLAVSQQDYLQQLTLPLEERLEQVLAPPFAELEQFVSRSGEALLEIARDEANLAVKGRIQADDGYLVEPWALMVQAINHATEHREQIKSMLSALGVNPPRIDGWGYAKLTGGLVPVDR